MSEIQTKWSIQYGKQLAAAILSRTEHRDYDLRFVKTSIEAERLMLAWSEDVYRMCVDTLQDMQDLVDKVVELHLDASSREIRPIIIPNPNVKAK